MIPTKNKHCDSHFVPHSNMNVTLHIGMQKIYQIGQSYKLVESQNPMCVC